MPSLVDAVVTMVVDGFDVAVAPKVEVEFRVYGEESSTIPPILCVPMAIPSI